MTHYLYKLTIAYDGTDFSGWQRQPQALTIQQVLEEKFQQILQTPIKIIGAGRTDAGVHALGQVAHFHLEKKIEPYRLLKSINSLIPPTIRILRIISAKDSFHAQKSAKTKIYHYHIATDRVLSPFLYRFRYHITYPLDLEAICQAQKYLIGTHNFAAFANAASQGAAGINPVRDLRRCVLVPEKGGFRLEFEANGFLYKMVRNMTGALIEVGRGKKTAEWIKQLLQSEDRTQGGEAADPRGLFLYRVTY